MSQNKNLFRYRLQTAISLYADTNHRRFQDIVDEINNQLGYPKGTVQEWLASNYVPNSAEVEYLAKKLTGGTNLDHKWIKELCVAAGYEPPNYLIAPKPTPPVIAAGETLEFNQAIASKYEREMQEYMASLTRVFLSYARLDQKFVEQLYGFLQENKLNPWMDIKNLVPGEDWMGAISREISQSDFFVFVLSENSYNRRGVIQREIRLALDRMNELLPDDIFIVSLRLDNCKIPNQLAQWQLLDWDDEHGRDRLLGAIQVGLERREN